MKKYLINGALALFAGAFVVSCSEKESDFVPLAEQKAKAFEEVFKELYGEPDPYQDWGFSSGKVEIDPNDTSLVVNVVDLKGYVGYTRAYAFGRDNSLLAFNAKTRVGEVSYEAGGNTNHNLWGDATYHFDVNVPPALTEGQKLRVRKYFQTHPNLTYEDPHYTKFFVQQVYKGNPETAGSLSPEKYQQTNDKWVTGSDNMDWLFTGRKNHHVNDFNDGDYNNGQTVQVLDNGANTNDYSTKSHPDQITLMLNSSTEYVAYGSSTASIKHTNCCALVGADVIDAWANDPVNYVDGKAIGEDVDDDWHRSFVGLDYEAGTLESLYSNKGNAKALDFCVSDYILYNGTIYQKSSFTDFELTAISGAKAHYLTDNVSNQGIARYIKDSNNNNVTKDTYNYNMSKETFATYGVTITNSEARVYNLDMVMTYVNQGAMPTDNNGNWVIYTGGRDYVYSDWIVTLTPAGTTPLPDWEYPDESINEWWMVEKGRVFCEDLGQATREDLDYNDVVFDAYIFKNYTKYTRWKVKKVNGVEVYKDIVEGPTEATKYYANVEILAAGGTIPVTIQSNIEKSPTYQVHDMFDPKADTKTMINTCDNKSSVHGDYDTRNSVQLGTDVLDFDAEMPEGGTQHFNIKLFEINKPLDEKFIKEIKITSSFGTATQVQEIGSVRGEVPRKFMAPIETTLSDGSKKETMWTSERKNISLAYPGFGDWVGGGDAPWANANPNYTYEGEYNPNGLKLPLVMKAKSTINTMGEQDLWQGPQEYQGTWSLANLPLTLNLDKFYPGDRLRFYGTNIGQDAWITVVIGSITPYFIDSLFPNYIIDAAGNTTYLTPEQSSCVEVLLDEDACDLLNNQISGGKVTFQVQGRNFTLTRICRVLFQ